MNKVYLNAISLNKVGSHRGKGAPQGTWEDYFASGADTLFIKDAKANSISSLKVFGGCVQNGTPSPTSPISIVCNRGAISYGVLGNNLLEVKDENIVVGKYINNAGVVTASLANIYFQRFVAVKPNVAYTLSASEDLNYVNFMEYDANGVFLKRTLYGSSSEPVGKSVTHTMGDTTAFVIVGSNVNSSKYPEITKADVKNIKWMFCEGSTVKAYEAYRAGYSYDGEDVISIEGGASVSADVLLSVTEYADTQDLVKGIVTRKVGIKVFDGSEDSWFLSMSGDVYRYRYKFDDDDNAYYKSGRGTDMACTHLKVLASGSAAGGAFLNGSSNSEYLFLIPDQSITTLESFRQWLQMQYAKGTPVMITYPLAEEVVENVAPQVLPNEEGDVTIIRNAEISGLAMEARLKVLSNKTEESKKITFVVYAGGVGTLNFEANEGMIWREYVASSYNADGQFVASNGYLGFVVNGRTRNLLHYSSSKPVAETDVIYDGDYYTTR